MQFPASTTPESSGRHDYPVNGQTLLRGLHEVLVPFQMSICINTSVYEHNCDNNSSGTECMLNLTVGLVHYQRNINSQFAKWKLTGEANVVVNKP